MWTCFLMYFSWCIAFCLHSDFILFPDQWSLTMQTFLNPSSPSPFPSFAPLVTTVPYQHPLSPYQLPMLPNHNSHTVVLPTSLPNFFGHFPTRVFLPNKCNIYDFYAHVLLVSQRFLACINSFNKYSYIRPTFYVCSERESNLNCHKRCL